MQGTQASTSAAQIGTHLGALTGVWQELVGQQDAVAQLQLAVHNPAQRSHAYLITGPPGSGRSIAARAFAAALQCPQGGCGQCNTCLTAQAGTHPDIRLVVTEGNVITRETVRTLVNTASTSPAVGNFRIIVMEDADRMSEGTFNVLLKSIEEPPPRTIWILCAPSAQDMPQTILSRCRQVRLCIPSPQDVADLLVRRDGVEAELAFMCAKAAQSHIGMARGLALEPKAMERRHKVLQTVVEIRCTGHAIVYAGELVEQAQADAKAATEERNAKERSDALRMLGVEGNTVPPALRAQLKALEEDQKRRASRVLRDSLDRMLIDMQAMLRDVLMIQLGSVAEADLIQEDFEGPMRSLARDSTEAHTLAKLAAVQQARTRIQRNVAPLLAFEALLTTFIRR